MGDRAVASVGDVARFDDDQEIAPRAIAFVVAAVSPLALNETLAAASLVGFAGIVESVLLNPPTPER